MDEIANDIAERTGRLASGLHRDSRKVSGPPPRLPPNLIPLVLLLFLLAGCSTTTPLRGHADLLDFLADSQTTKDEVLLKLGQPSAEFQSEKILTYRLGREEKNRGYYVVTREINRQGWPTWVNAKFSLVLVFDAQGVLRQHSLVEVN